MKKIITFILLIAAINCQAQNDTSKYYNSTDYGWKYQRLKAKLALVLPSDTVGNKVVGSIVFLNSEIYKCDPTGWHKISLTEVDPIFMASPAAGISSQYIANWNTAFGWGNHATQGYATQTYVDNSVANYVPLSQKASFNGVATLDGAGYIPSSQIPPIAINKTYVVGSQSAMLALSANVGDIAIRTDIDNNFILQSTPATTLSNWVMLLSPPAPVQSVNGYTGTVNLTTTDISEGTNKYYTDDRVQEFGNTKYVKLTGLNNLDAAQINFRNSGNLGPAPLVFTNTDIGGYQWWIGPDLGNGAKHFGVYCASCPGTVFDFNGIDNSANFTGNVTSPKFITTGGTSSTFVKGNGDLDATTYIPNTSVSGTTNAIPKFTGSNAVGNSNIAQTATGGRVLINAPTDDGSNSLQVNGNIRLTGDIVASGGATGNTIRMNADPNMNFNASAQSGSSINLNSRNGFWNFTNSGNSTTLLALSNLGAISSIASLAASANNQSVHSYTATASSRTTANDTLYGRRAIYNDSIKSTNIKAIGEAIELSPIIIGGVSAGFISASSVAGMTATTYNNVAPASTTGAGTGALFTVVVTSATQATITPTATAGNNYKLGDALTFNGSQFAGSGNVVFTLTAVTGSSISANTSVLTLKNNLPTFNSSNNWRYLDLLNSSGQSFGSIGRYLSSNIDNLAISDRSGLATYFDGTTMFLNRALSAGGTALFSSTLTVQGAASLGQSTTLGNSGENTTGGNYQLQSSIVALYAAGGTVDYFKITPRMFLGGRNTTASALYINPTFSTSEIDSVIIINSGSGYTNGSYTGIGYASTNSATGSGRYLSSITIKGGVATAVAGGAGGNQTTSFSVGDTLTLGSFGGGTGVKLLVVRVGLSGTNRWAVNAQNGGINHVQGDNYFNTTSGNTSFGLSTTTSSTSKVDVNGTNGYSQLRLRTSYTPTSTADTNGNVGDTAWDDNYFYIKTTAGWKRSALSTF